MMQYMGKPSVIVAEQLKEDKEIQTSSGIITGREGHWVIKDNDGNFSICEDAFFLKNYFDIESEKTDEQLENITSVIEILTKHLMSYNHFCFTDEKINMVVSEAMRRARESGIKNRHKPADFLDFDDEDEFLNL